MQLYTPRLILREFCESDLPAVRAIEQDPHIQYYERAVPDDEEVRFLFQKLLEDGRKTPRTHYRFAVTIRPEDTVHGRISLTLQNSQIKEWEIGWRINHAEWDNGYATEAAREVMHFAFTQLNAHRVIAFCHIENRASMRVMEKLGMTREGVTRETRWINNAWTDEAVYAILEKEFIHSGGDRR